MSKNTLIDILAVFVGGPIIICAQVLRFLNHCYCVASSTFVRSLALAVAAFLLWPLVDHCLLHFHSGVTIDLLKAEILARWEWLTGLTISIVDRTPSGVTMLPVFKSACLAVGIAIFATAFLTFAGVKATISGLYAAVECAASDSFDRIATRFKALRKAPRRTNG